MCGIVGYIGTEQAAPIILDGLSKLEYRGYDSAGMAIFDGEKINTRKAVGRLKVLENLTHGGENMKGTSGIDNLFMISGFDGVDPEAISGNYYPLTRNYSFGLNVTF